MIYKSMIPCTMLSYSSRQAISKKTGQMITYYKAVFSDPDTFDGISVFGLTEKCVESLKSGPTILFDKYIGKKVYYHLIPFTFSGVTRLSVDGVELVK